jgi:integrase
VKTALTDRAIRAARPAAKAYDMHDAVVPGLSLNILPSGVKRFVLLRRFPGGKHPTRRALGAYGGLTLEKARDKARHWLELIARGLDPAEEVARLKREQDARRATTFAAVIEDYIRIEVQGHGKHPRQRTADKITAILRETFAPLLGHRPITELTAVEILTPIELIGQIGTDHALLRLRARKTLQRPGRKSQPAREQARKLFAIAERIFNWASEPRAGYGLDRSPLERVRKSRLGASERRDRTLNDEELAALQLGVGHLEPPYRQAYQTLLLTGLRLNEAVQARWSEIEGDVWTIPAERMKGKNGQARPHVVPITPALRKVFDTVPRGSKGDFIFSRDNGATAVTIISRVKADLDKLMLEASRRRAIARGEDSDKAMLRPWRNHDIRRTCRTTLSRLGVSYDVAEAVLAHAIGGVGGIYDRWERFPEKRDALERWAKFLGELSGPRLATVAEAG